MQDLPITRIELLEGGQVAITPADNPNKILRFAYRADEGVEWEDDTLRLVARSPSAVEAFSSIARALASEMGMAMTTTSQTAWVNVSSELRRAFERVLGNQQGAPPDGPASRARG